MFLKYILLGTLLGASATLVSFLSQIWSDPPFIVAMLAVLAFLPGLVASTEFLGGEFMGVSCIIANGLLGAILGGIIYLLRKWQGGNRKRR